MREAHKSIKSEKRLIEVLKNTANCKNEPLKTCLLNKINEGKIIELCQYFGIINYSKPIE